MVREQEIAPRLKEPPVKTQLNDLSKQANQIRKQVSASLGIADPKVTLIHNGPEHHVYVVPYLDGGFWVAVVNCEMSCLTGRKRHRTCDDVVWDHTAARIQWGDPEAAVKALEAAIEAIKSDVG